MSLESILERILAEAVAQQEKIIQEALTQAEKVMQEARQSADILYQDILQKAKADSLSQKQMRIVNARLGHKRNILEAKQELIESVFKKTKSTLKDAAVKKQLVFADKVSEAAADIDFYLSTLRQDYESEIARILFK